MIRIYTAIAGRWLVISILLLSFVISGCGKGDTNLRAVAGVLDLSAWNFQERGLAYLDGEWEFFWGRLYKPGEFGGDGAPVKTGFFFIPGFWNGYRVNGNPIDGDGCATFRLRVILPHGKKELALRIEDQSTAYRLWINGVLIMENGVVAEKPDAGRPYKKILTATLLTEEQSLDCILQVSNYHMSQGGPYRRIALGSKQEILQRQNNLFLIDFALFIFLAAFGVYHLVFYLLRRRDPSLAYFGLFCLCWCAGIPFGAAGGRFITLIMPDTPWYLMSRMELLTWFPTVPLFLMFFASIFPVEFSSRVIKAAQVIAVIFFIFVLFTPSGLAGLTEVPYQIFTIAIALYICWRLYIAIRHRRSESALMLTGFIIFLGTAINDILYMNLMIYSIYLISAGIAVMILFQSFALARRFARSFSAVESLTGELTEKNIALSRLDRLRDEFLANTSHELRTPLNGIVGLAESLLTGVTGSLPLKARENLSLIVASGRRLTRLINDIMDLSRLRNSDLKLHMQAVDMKALTDTVLTVMKPLAHGKPLKLINSIPDTLPPVWGDESRLQQVLYNLIGNSVKFTDQGEIRISADIKGDLMEFSISDTGSGIPENRHDEVFKPFGQADAMEGRAYGGVGLGLSITKHLVELHGGSIGFQSEPDAGSLFYFTIPVIKNPSQQASATVPHVPEDMGKESFAATGGGMESIGDLSGLNGDMQILAVDDDPVNLRVVTNYLDFNNVKVITKVSGKQAVQAVENGLLPDLVLLDIMMPKMNGNEVLLWLRQRYTSSELPVILLTAKNGEDDLAEGFSQGANDYLVKPFLRDELLARVVSQLKLKETYLTLRENLALRKELEERKQVEKELRTLHQGLGLMLDSLDEILLAVNEEMEITFCNRGCEELLGYKAEDLLGRPVLEIIQPIDEEGSSEKFKDSIRQCIASEKKQDIGETTFRRVDGKFIKVHLVISMLDVDDAPLCLMILRKKEGKRQEALSEKRIAQNLSIIEIMNRNRSRLKTVQASLDSLMPLIPGKESELLRELNAIDEALENTGITLLSEENYESRRSLAAEVMTCALEYWTESTGLTRAEMAHQSKLWKVYVNQDGWERTQTLDRYLNKELFPQRPAWGKIFRTAEFVLGYSKKSSILRNRLEGLLMELRISR